MNELKLTEEEIVTILSEYVKETYNIIPDKIRTEHYDSIPDFCIEFKDRRVKKNG